MEMFALLRLKRLLDSFIRTKHDSMAQENNFTWKSQLVTLLPTMPVRIRHYIKKKSVSTATNTVF